MWGGAHLDRFVVDERVDGQVAGLVLGFVHEDTEASAPLGDAQREGRVSADAAQRHRREFRSKLGSLCRRSRSTDGATIECGRGRKTTGIRPELKE